MSDSGGPWLKPSANQNRARGLGSAANTGNNSSEKPVTPHCCSVRMRQAFSRRTGSAASNDARNAALSCAGAESSSLILVGLTCWSARTRGSASLPFAVRIASVRNAYRRRSASAGLASSGKSRQPSASKTSLRRLSSAAEDLKCLASNGSAFGSCRSTSNRWAVSRRHELESPRAWTSSVVEARAGNLGFSI